MKILITGSKGFIGIHLLNDIGKSHEVICSKLRFEDINDDMNYAEYFDYPDAVIHLAWEGLPNYRSLSHFDNIAPQYTLLNNLVRNGVTNITVTGTCLEYGMQEGCLHESAIPKPDNPYSMAKDALRKLLEKIPGINLKWVRLFYMYGIGQNERSLIPQLQNALNNGDSSFNMSAGDQLRDFLPVEVIADYLVKIAVQTEVTGIINCCSGNPISVLELVTNYLKHNNRYIKLNTGHYPYPDYEPKNFWGHSEKLKSII